MSSSRASLVARARLRGAFCLYVSPRLALIAPLLNSTLADKDNDDPKSSWVLVGEAIVKMADNRRNKGSERKSGSDRSRLGLKRLSNLNNSFHSMFGTRDEEAKKAQQHNELVAHFKMRRLSFGQSRGLQGARAADVRRCMRLWAPRRLPLRALSGSETATAALQALMPMPMLCSQIGASR